MSEVVLDSETRSKCDLRLAGARRYAEDPTTEKLCVCWWDYDYNTMSVWVPEKWRDLIMLDQLQAGGDKIVLEDDLSELHDKTIIGNNVVGFDRLMLPEVERVEWIDTMFLARQIGLPGGLDAQGKALFNHPKDDTGKRLIKMLCKDFVPPNAQLLTGMVQYCMNDVRLSARVWEYLREYEGGVEADVRAADQAINDRGFCFDDKLAMKLLEVERELRALERRIVEQMGVTPDQLSSWQKFQKLMRERWSIGMSSTTADVCKALIAHPDVPREAKMVLWARIGETRIAAPKMERALAMMETDGRLRATLSYGVANPTLRWGGRGFQPQNLPRPVKGLKEDALRRAIDGDLVAVAREAGRTPDEVLATLVRSCIVAPEGKTLGNADFSGIEARGLAWIAGDQRDLEIYRSGRDPYKIMAMRIFGVAYDDVTDAMRFVGKVAVLGCGYQMGIARFASHAANFGLDLEAAGVDAARVVEAWRDAHPLIAGERRDEEYNGTQLRTGGLWKDLHYGVRRVVEREIGELYVGKCSFTMSGPHLACELPSGRAMYYRNALVENVRPGWADADSDERVATIMYDHVQGKSIYRKATYGGRLTENIVQALCRDLFAHSLVRLEKAGFATVAHVHDEIVVELEDESVLPALLECFVETPSWATGLPVAAEGNCGQRYGKRAATASR